MDIVGRRIGRTAWGRLYGLDKATMARRHHAGRLPPALPMERLPNGCCHVIVPPERDGCGVVYARVSSTGRKADRDRQVSRVGAWATQPSCRLAEVVKGIGSGLHGNRRRWRRRVAEHTLGKTVVEPQGRLSIPGLST